MSLEIKNFDPRPIGVFDSGVGGLSVLNQLINHFPEENFVYLGDTARLPYGSKSPLTIQKYVTQNINYLVRHQQIKAVVVACNSASTVLSQIQLASDLPVFGVIKPGARAAFQISKTKKIGLWATRATVKQESYPKALKDLDSTITCISVPCPLLVPLVEEGLWQGDIVDAVLNHYFNQTDFNNLDTLILGCTHYPFIKSSIEKVIHKKNLKVNIIDSALALAEDLSQAFKNNLVQKNSSALKKGSLSLLLTDEASHFMELALKTFPSWENSKFQLIDLNQIV
jgi:glutamate racemase